MKASNAERDARWSALLAEPGGPGGRYDQMLERMRTRAQEPRTGAGERVLAGNDEALAAVAVIRGAAAALPFADAAMPVVAAVGQKLAISPASIDPVSVLMMLSFAGIGETLGSAVPEPPFDVDRRLDDLLLHRTFSPPDRMTLALLLLARQRSRHVRTILGHRGGPTASSAEEMVLIETLAATPKRRGAAADLEPAWNAFVNRFPAALQEERAEWRHLLLAGRIVLPRLELAPIGGVADALHRAAAGRAAEERP
jgi:hypothetical protein